MKEIDKEDYYLLKSKGYDYPEIMVKWADTCPTYWCKECLIIIL